MFTWFRQDFNDSATTIPWISKKTTWPWTWTTLACFFFGLGDDVDFRCIDCRLVSRSYVNIQVLSQVVIEFNKSGSFSMHCKTSKHNYLRRSFCSSDSTFGTIFAQTFLMFNSFLRILQTLSCPNWLPQLLLKHPTFGLFESHLALF